MSEVTRMSDFRGGANSSRKEDHPNLPDDGSDGNDAEVVRLFPEKTKTDDYLDGFNESDRAIVYGIMENVSEIADIEEAVPEDEKEEATNRRRIELLEAENKMLRSQLSQAAQDKIKVFEKEATESLSKVEQPNQPPEEPPSVA